MVRDEIYAMRLSRAWSEIGATTLRAILSGSGSGEGDSAGQPTQSPSLWPTLVIEGSYSRSWNSLRLKKDWWFAASEGAVKIVILIKFSIRENIICIEKYLPTSISSAGPGTTSTRMSSTTRPGPDQRIQIYPHQAERSDPSSFIVNGGPLIIEFHLLFLRPPTGTEHDIVIGTTNLQFLATEVWRAYARYQQMLQMDGQMDGQMYGQKE